MSTNKMHFLIAATGLLILTTSVASADSIKKLEKEQLGNSAAPDVDPGASKGPDNSIVKQQDDQIGNSAQPDVDASASKGHDKSIVDQEREQIPH
jgi:hypothetical protein